MTWIGKILTFMVLILALAGVWLVATAFATRTNWRVQADAYKKGFETAVAARTKEYDLNLKQISALREENEKLSSALKGSQGIEKDLRAANEKNQDELAKLNKAQIEANKTIMLFDSERKGFLAELDILRPRNKSLEMEQAALVRAKEQAIRDALAAKNEADFNRNLATDLSKRNDDLTARVAELQASGGRPSVAKLPPALPDNLRGTVTAVDRDLIELSLGIDAGLEVGSVLDIYRLTPEGKYLGRVVVNNVYAKKAVATFKPSSNKPLARLRPEELPRVGDLVGKQDQNRASLK